MTTITESRTFVEAAKPAPGTGMLDIVFITEGWGSSGYYAGDMLQEAAKDNVFQAGTQMFINHPTATEAEERPVRDLNYLAAVLAEDAYYDPKVKGLRGPVKTFPAWRESLAEMAPYIGVSIRAAADVEEGEVDGRQGVIVKKITEGLSVDFVTKAGRGGHVVEVLESAIEKGLHAATPPVKIVEALQSDVREALQKTVRKAYGKPYEEGVGGVYVWLRDYDPDASVAYFTVEDEDYKTYQQTYDEAFNLTGDRTEVRATTIYVPVAAPSGSPSTSTNTESQEDKMATLEEAEAKVTTLTQERDTAIARAEEAERKLKNTENYSIAVGIVAEAFNALDVAAPKTVAAVAAQFKLTEAGEIDKEALKTLASEAAAEIAEARGQDGQVRGLGHDATATGDDISESDLDAGLARLSGRKIVKEA